MRSARGLPKLNYEQVEASELPEPYQSLLVHEGDMTSRLEAFHKSEQRVKAIRSSNSGKKYFREVILEPRKQTKRLNTERLRFSWTLCLKKCVKKLLKLDNPLVAF